MKIGSVYIIKSLNIKKIFYIILITIPFLFILFIVFIILLLCGKIQDYTYINVNNDNKEKIISLLQEQEDNMFIKDKDKIKNECYKKLNRIEVVFRFPDGEDYTLYCGKNKISFSLDNSNYNLPKYISENGHIGLRFN